MRQAHRGRKGGQDSRFLASLFDNNPQPMWVFDRSTFEFLYVNKAAVAKYGYGHDEFLRMKATDLRPAEEASVLTSFVAELSSQPAGHSAVWRHRLKNGSLIDVEVLMRPIRWGRREAVLTVVHDITTQTAERELLQSSQEHLRSLVEHAEDYAVFTLDPGGLVASWNEGAARVCGFREKDILGRHFGCLYREEEARSGKPEALLRAAAASGGAREEGWQSRKDGSLLWASVALTPLRGPQDRLKGFVMVVRDVSERQRTDQLLRQQAAAMRASMDGMAIIGEQGQFLYVNDALAKTYGYTGPEELMSKTWSILFRSDEVRRFEGEILPALRRVGQWRGEAAGQRKDGSLFPQEISLTRIEGGGHVCVVRDITGRKLIEEDHARLLEIEKTARSAAEAASRDKDEFLAVVSHELRTPMTAILGWTYLLRSGSLGDSDRRHALEAIERNMKLQSQIIEDLLDISSIVTGKLHLVPRATDLRAVINAAVEQVRPASREKSLTVELELGDRLNVHGDPTRLQQIFFNLASNAVKFNRHGGRVWVRGRAEDGSAVIVFQDEGQGISPHFLPALFDPFRQEENPLTRMHSGLGIGLAIVKHLVAYHGGTVTATSPGRGHGATFTVVLPLSLQPPEPAAPALPSAAPAQVRSLVHALDGVDILLVDDEPDTLQVLAGLLEHCGAQVRTASSVSEALDLYQERRPGVLVADIAMPGEDGYSLIRKARSLGGARVRALALTAHTRPEDRARALQSGYDSYLPKPVEAVELVAAIRSLAEKRD